MREFTIRLPISLEIGVRKKKKYFINLNVYRNKVGFLMNNIKKEYHRLAEPLIPKMKFNQARITYTLYLPDERKRDIGNVLSMVDKFFCDSLVTMGVLKDDNYLYIEEIDFRLGGFDPKGRGYVDILVKEVS